jgi:putative AdoMet-dependent methyltransferase
MTQVKKQIPKWYYDENKPCGVDYTSYEEVAVYDEMHMKFRDYEKGADEIIKRLDLGPDSVVIDMGCGTGAFALNASRKCRLVYAVDISATMLNYCREKAGKHNLFNIFFCKAGVLTYEHTGEPADAIICIAVLHHLPGFWKQIALNRCFSMLKPGGKLLLFDIVFPSDDGSLPAGIEEWILSIESMANARLAREAEIHVREEFSTYDWIIEGFIKRSGFHIDKAEYGPGFNTTYICVKPENI